MIIGVPRECMRDEQRVGLMPSQVAQLVAEGHRVGVEAGAGCAAGFADDAYRLAGAALCGKAEAFGAELVVKVKCPLADEYRYLRTGQTVFTYLHFDGNAAAADILAMVGSGFTGIAYEWVEEQGRYPLLEPMSRITGALFARRALDMLLTARGHIGGGYGLGCPPARAMVIGLGHIGAHATDVLARNDVSLVLVDKHPETIDVRLRAIQTAWTGSRVERVIAFDENDPDSAVRALRAELPRIDILIGAAVRRPCLTRERCRYLVDRAAVATMRPGSILCDATANIRDFFETAVPTLGLHETYEECGVIHYNCEHLPSLAAHSATLLLTNATFPYVRRLAAGLRQALINSPGLRRGTMCHAGRLTDALTARNKDLEWTHLTSLV